MSVLAKGADIPKLLGDGLQLRRSTAADTEALATFIGQYMVEGDEVPIIFEAWTTNMMSEQHPNGGPNNFVLVEDMTTGEIASVSGFLSLIWRYEDVLIPVGRPELVATAPDYRRRGLVRAIFDELHALSGSQGHLMQSIMGIEWFYRQFGYEYALPLGGGRKFDIRDVPKLKEDEAESYLVRPASVDDIPVLQRLYERQYADNLVCGVINEARWRYDLTGHNPDSMVANKFWMIMDRADRPVGYYQTAGVLWGDQLHVFALAVDQDVSLKAILPTVLRALNVQAESLVTKEDPTVTGFEFTFGLYHPLYSALPQKLGPLRRPYAWYIRVPDLPTFLFHIKSVLERRLASSVMCGFSGELKISFYQGGLRLVFEQGQLIEVTDWQAPDQASGRAGFPPGTFLQLLFGYRSLETLRGTFPDCWARGEASILLNALFPEKKSWVYPLG